MNGMSTRATKESLISIINVNFFFSSPSSSFCWADTIFVVIFVRHKFDLCKIERVKAVWGGCLRCFASILPFHQELYSLKSDQWIFYFDIAFFLFFQSDFLVLVLVGYTKVEQRLRLKRKHKLILNFNGWVFVARSVAPTHFIHIMFQDSWIERGRKVLLYFR